MPIGPGKYRPLPDAPTLARVAIVIVGDDDKGHSFTVQTTGSFEPLKLAVMLEAMSMADDIDADVAHTLIAVAGQIRTDHGATAPHGTPAAH